MDNDYLESLLKELDSDSDDEDLQIESSLDSGGRAIKASKACPQTCCATHYSAEYFLILFHKAHF